MNSLPFVLTSAAVVAITGVFGSASDASNRHSGNPNVSRTFENNPTGQTPQLELPTSTRIVSFGPNSDVAVQEKNQKTKEQTTLDSNSSVKKYPWNVKAKEFKPTPSLPTTSIDTSIYVYDGPSYRGSKAVNFDMNDLQTALPPALYRSITELGYAGDLIKLGLQIFFCTLHNNSGSSASLNGILSNLQYRVNRDSKAAITHTGAKCNDELLSSLDAFLRCYTAVYLVCDVENREYLRKNGFIKSIKDFIIFINKSPKPFDQCLMLAVNRNFGGLCKENIDQLSFSFIRYFKSLVSSKLMAGEFGISITSLFTGFESFLKDAKNTKQAINPTFVVGDVLTVGFKNLKGISPKYAYAVRTGSAQPYIPSMLITPFRIYITSLFQTHHRQLSPYARRFDTQTVASATKSDVDLFWAFVEPAFEAFDDASNNYLNKIDITHLDIVELQMHHSYLNYCLQTHIFGTIEFAVDHFEYLKMKKAAILNECKSLLETYLKFELLCLNSPRITLLPSINQPTPYDVISNCGISSIMNSISEQMGNTLQGRLQPAVAYELSVLAAVLSRMANSFWFRDIDEKSLCSGTFLSLQNQFSTAKYADVAQHESITSSSNINYEDYDFTDDDSSVDEYPDDLNNTASRNDNHNSFTSSGKYSRYRDRMYPNTNSSLSSQSSAHVDGSSSRNSVQSNYRGSTSTSIYSTTTTSSTSSQTSTNIQGAQNASKRKE